MLNAYFATTNFIPIKITTEIVIYAFHVVSNPARHCGNAVT